MAELGRRLVTHEKVLDPRPRQIVENLVIDALGNLATDSKADRFIEGLAAVLENCLLHNGRRRRNMAPTVA